MPPGQKVAEAFSCRPLVVVAVVVVVIVFVVVVVVVFHIFVTESIFVWASHRIDDNR